MHQYLHGLSALALNVAGLFDALAVPPIEEDDFSADPPDSRRREAIDLLRTIDYLVQAERYSALNCLAHLRPGFLPGVERSERVAANPMEEFRAVLPPHVFQARQQCIEIAFDPLNRSRAMPLVQLERHSFRRLAHNLLSNAVKYSYHGSAAKGRERERVVRIWCQPRHDEHSRHCLIAVQNYGIGIEADEMSRIGEPGYRGRLACQEVEIGTGLGISEAKQIAQAHGGRLRITSRRPDAGSPYLTTVEVILPVSFRHRRRNQA